MRLHEITNTPGDYLVTDFQIENMIAEQLRTVGNIRSSAAGCSHRQPTVSRDTTRVARPAARPLPDLLPDQKPAIPYGCPTCPTNL
jgi:hypothetical protein